LQEQLGVAFMPILLKSFFNSVPTPEDGEIIGFDDGEIIGFDDGGGTNPSFGFFGYDI